MIASAGHLRTVYGNGPRARGDHSATFFGQFVESLSKLFWDLIALDYG
jgi:hypothetical protein